MKPPEWPTPPAVVIGLDNITGLQTARILAARGVPVVGLVADRRHWAARTNACVDVMETELSGEGLLAGLRRLEPRLGGRSVLLPCTDLSVETLSRHRDELSEQFILPLAKHSVVELLMDKVRFAQHASEVGLPIPRTEVLSTRAEVASIAEELVYPCVLKPAIKSRTWLAQTSAKAFAISDAQHLLSVYDVVGGWVPLLLVQEWVPGSADDLFTCNAYFDAAGHPLVTFVSRKVRQWPPDIGTGASSEESRNDEVVDTIRRVFGDVGFHGLAYLEMKRHATTGRMMIIEPNVGRPTGRSAIAEAGGVELLYTAYCDALGQPLPAARQQRYGDARWVDVRRDLQAAAVARRNGTLTMREWMRWLRGPKAHAIWSREDPAPFVTDLVQASARAGGMLKTRLLSTTRGAGNSRLNNPLSTDLTGRGPALAHAEEGDA